jgi:ABC-type sugar transport system permease subunit
MGRLIEKISPLIFLIPPFLAIGVVFYGIIQTIYLSFTNARLIGGTVNFVGLSNYERLFSDPLFYTSLQNNILFLIFLVVFPILIGLFIAILLNQKIKGAGIFRALFFFPLIISFVVAGNIWSWIFLTQSGLINSILRSLGLEFFTQGWLTNPDLVISSMSLAGIWQLLGLPVILFSAGLVDIPDSTMDAARLEASTFQIYRYVIIPLLKPLILGVATLAMISAFKVFDLVLIMTYGGPLTKSYVLSFMIYIRTISGFEVGYGSAISTILFAISMGCIILVLYLSSRRK